MVKPFEGNLIGKRRDGEVHPCSVGVTGEDTESICERCYRAVWRGKGA